MRSRFPQSVPPHPCLRHSAYLPYGKHPHSDRSRWRHSWVSCPVLRCIVGRVPNGSRSHSRLLNRFADLSSYSGFHAGFLYQRLAYGFHKGIMPQGQIGRWIIPIADAQFVVVPFLMIKAVDLAVSAGHISRARHAGPDQAIPKAARNGRALRCSGSPR